MMAESCETCLMPFMKKNNKTICVICTKNPPIVPIKVE
jgi:uncharacterized Zn finger protein (UPF0148 family)